MELSSLARHINQDRTIRLVATARLRDVVLLKRVPPDDLDALSEIEGATSAKIRGLSWNELFRDHGLKWEELKSRPGSYPFRVSQSHRIVAARNGDYPRLMTPHPDHHGASVAEEEAPDT